MKQKKTKIKYYLLMSKETAEELNIYKNHMTTDDFSLWFEQQINLEKIIKMQDYD